MVSRVAGQKSLGRLFAGTVTILCALGGAGIGLKRREGDGVTPTGRFHLDGGFFRQDRLFRPRSLLQMRPITRSSGWCDDPSSPNYNRKVNLPIQHGHEKLWRPDNLYDLFFVIDYNFRPKRKGRGSAIFLHIAKDSFQPTEGCVAISAADMKRLAARLAARVCLIIKPG